MKKIKFSSDGFAFSSRVAIVQGVNPHEDHIDAPQKELLHMKHRIKQNHYENI
jgi:hypothetical protein